MRQPQSGLNELNAHTETIEAAAIPPVDAAWITELPKPRRFLSQTSLNSTMPAPHSPPRPIPVMARVTRSELKSQAKAERIAPTENRPSVHSNEFLRPTRSPSHPNRTPPITEPAKVTVVMMPACVRLRLSDF